MNDPYEKVWKSIDENFKRTNKMIILLAERALSVKEYKEFAKEFEEEFPRNPDKDDFILMYRGRELVQCKNCKYYTEPDSHGDRCSKIHWSKNADWFCADGVKKDG